MGISGGYKVCKDFSSAIDPDAAEAFLPYTEGAGKGCSSLALSFTASFIPDVILVPVRVQQLLQRESIGVGMELCSA